jgi:hypothetical protein
VDKKLDHFGLDHRQYQNGGTLLRLPKSVTCSATAFSDPALIPELRSRGVALRIIG